MLDRVPAAVSVGAESEVLIAESQALQAWTRRAQADMEFTIEASRRALRDARKLMTGADPYERPRLARWPRP